MQSTTLKIAGILVAVVTFGFWFFGGLHLGRSRIQQNFVAGIDLLALGLSLAILLYLASYLSSQPPKQDG